MSLSLFSIRIWEIKSFRLVHSQCMCSYLFVYLAAWCARILPVYLPESWDREFSLYNLSNFSGRHSIYYVYIFFSSSTKSRGQMVWYTYVLRGQNDVCVCHTTRIYVLQYSFLMSRQYIHKKSYLREFFPTHFLMSWDTSPISQESIILATLILCFSSPR